MSHLLLVTLHLLAAITFAGSVFFEVFVLAAVGKSLGRKAMLPVEAQVARRLRHLMPFVLAVLYGAGIALAWSYRDLLAHPLESGFATLLTIKILLASSVLLHFITAVILGARGRLTAFRVRVIHASVIAHLVLIVILAQAMFEVSW